MSDRRYRYPPARSDSPPDSGYPRYGGSDDYSRPHRGSDFRARGEDLEKRRRAKIVDLRGPKIVDKRPRRVHDDPSSGEERGHRHHARHNGDDESLRAVAPSDLIRCVERPRVMFNPSFVQVRDSGPRQIEIELRQFVPELAIKEKLAFSGRLTRFARLSFTTLFAEFETPTMARHAVARMSRRKGGYRPRLAGPDINMRIGERVEAARCVHNPKKCLAVYNFVLQTPRMKLAEFMAMFDKVEYEVFPNEHKLVTYHENEASVKDFYLAFENDWGLVSGRVMEEVNSIALKQKVFQLVVEQLIRDCCNDCSEMLGTDLYDHALRRARMEQRATMVARQQLRLSTGRLLNFFFPSRPLFFTLSPLVTESVSVLVKKVKKATKAKKTEMLKKDMKGYQTKVQKEMDEAEETFETIEQPAIERGSSRLTPVHKIEEFNKRHYLRPYAKARLHPLVVARKSGLTLLQSQFTASSSDGRRKKTTETHSVGKRVYFEKSTIQGWGLFALEPISAESFVCEYTGDIVRNLVGDKRERQYENEGLPHMYLFRIDEEYIVDATQRGGKARFLNHSCYPNCRSNNVNVGRHQTISFTAIRNIKPHDEITFNYKMEYEEDSSKWERCYCGSKQCVAYLNARPDAELAKQGDRGLDENWDMSD